MFDCPSRMYLKKVNNSFLCRFLKLLVKLNVGFETHLQQGIPEPIYYGDVVYKFKRKFGKPSFLTN